MSKFEHAVESLKRGKMILVYDGDEREGEADLMIAARFMKPEIIRKMRQDAGGLICLAIPNEAAARFDLPFMTDALVRIGGTSKELSCKRTAYGDKPAFSLAINHQKVFTGITDNDRALTIKEMDKLVRNATKTKEEMISNFYSPGHVFLLISRGIENRKGHTELSIELAERAGLDGGMVMCEMLGEGKALPKKDVIGYAKKNGLDFVEGKEIIDASVR